MTYIDAHSHLADPRLDEIRAELLLEARQCSIDQHLQGGVGPDDWARQRALQKLHPEILPVFGLHPYFVASHNEKECTAALDQLAREIGPAFALGELGLDFRPGILKGDPEGRHRQINCFESQLDLAKVSSKPIVLHIVRAHEEALRILQIWGIPDRGGFIHSFNGTTSEAKSYLEAGLHISVGGPLARVKNQKLRQAVKEIPLERLLLETDSPDQPGDSLHGQLNRPASLWQVAEVVALIKNISVTEVLDSTSSNCRKLLSL